MEIKNGLNNNKKFNIPSRIKSYKIEKELFQISNSHICLATNLNLKEKVLIKIYDKEIIQHNSNEIYLINNEIFKMKLINHKHCLKLYEIIESSSYIFLIMEYFTGTKLSDYITQKKKFTEEESLNIYKQILSSLIYFHDMNIGHLNINPNNILINASNNIKICDFRNSIFYISKDKIKCEYFGEKEYLSPELISEKSCFPEYADVWASGVLLYLLIVGQMPFKGINKYDLEKKIMGAEFALPLNINKNLQEFFKNIFEVNTDVRYNFEKIMNSALFKEKKINKNNLIKGFNIIATKYPIDNRIIQICEQFFNIKGDDLKQKLHKNIFDPQTSLYKQIIDKFIRKKISTELDLHSKKFNNYISNMKNSLDNNSQQNNIEENLSFNEKTNSFYQEQKAQLEQSQNKALIKLDELIEKYSKIQEKIEKEEKEKKEEAEKDKEKEEIIDKEKEKEKEENKENIIKNKENKKNPDKKEEKNVKILNKKYKKRGTLAELPKNLENKLFESKLSNNIPKYRKRRSIFSDSQTIFKSALTRLNSDQNNKNAKRKDLKQIEIIKEINEELFREPSAKTSNKYSRTSSLSKSNSIITEKMIHLNKSKKNTTDNIRNNNSNNNSSKIIYDKKDINTPSQSKKNIKSQKEKNTTSKPPPKQITKEEFFNQIRGVKLKKCTPNTYVNPDEIKKKTTEENNNSTPVENTNVSVKNITQMIEKNLNITKKNKNNTTVNSKKPRQSKAAILLSQLSKSKENKIIKSEDSGIKKSDSKHDDDNKNLSITKNLFKDISKEEQTKKELEEQERKKKEEENKKRKEEERKLKEEEEKRLKQEEERKLKEEEERKRKEEERKLKEEEEKRRKEEEEKRLKEEEERKRKEEEKRRKEEEEKRRKELEELRLRRLEEERIRKELEEEERLLKQREEELRQKQEEEERQRKLEEELKKKRQEEHERRMKEIEEDNKRREEEERIKREKEKERIRLEEEEKIKKWKEEIKRQKEAEEKRQKELEEKEKKEEEEKIRIRKEQSEKKRREEQEQHRRLLEEFEKKRKEEEEKRIQQEMIKKKKEEELKLLREKQFKERSEKKVPKSIIEKSSETESESEEESEEKPIKKKPIIKKTITENQTLNKKRPSKNFKLHTNPFFLYKKQNSDDSKSSSPKAQKVQPKKRISKKIENISHFKKRPSYRPKISDINKFRESDLIESESISEEEQVVINNKKEKNIDNKKKDIIIENNNLKKRLYSQFTDYFFNNSVNHVSKKENKKQDIIQKNNKSDNKKKIFYKYQNKKEKELPNFFERSFQKRNKVENPQYNGYININDEYLVNYEKSFNQRRPSQKSYRRLKIKNKDNKNNDVRSIKIRNEIYNTSSVYDTASIESEIFSNSYATNPIRANGSFKKNNIKRLLKEKTAKISNNFYKENDQLSKSTYIRNNMKENEIIPRGYETLDYNTNSVILNSSISSSKTKKKVNSKIKNNNIVIHKNIKTNITEFDLNNHNKRNKSLIKIKKNIQNNKLNIKEEELNLFRGKIDYNNVSVKNIEECIEDLLKKYKNKGYTCTKKDKIRFKFVKGPYIHNVEIMRLGNGLLYFNIIKQ